jgi:hypothetical protein
MLPVGMLLTWAGYSVSLWGWCLIRGYNVTLGQLMSPAHPYGSGKGEAWPPPLMSPNQIFPGKNTGESAPAATPAAAPATARTGRAAAGLPSPSGSLGPGGTVVK